MYSLYLHTSFNLTSSWKFFVPQSTSIFNYFFDFESTARHIVIHEVKQKYISAILKIR